MYNQLVWVGVGALAYLVYEYEQFQQVQPGRTDRTYYQRSRPQDFVGKGRNDLYEYSHMEPGKLGQPQYVYRHGAHHLATYVPLHLAQ